MSLIILVTPCAFNDCSVYKESLRDRTTSSMWLRLWWLTRRTFNRAIYDRDGFPRRPYDNDSAP